MTKSTTQNFEEVLRTKGKIVFIDGTCTFCHWSVNLNQKLSKKHNSYYGTLQGYASELKKTLGKEPQLNTVLLYKNGTWFKKLDVVLELAKDFKQPQRFFYRSLIMIPKVLRNKLYDFIARNRYRWFGQKEHCQLPDIGLRNRLLAK